MVKLQDDNLALKCGISISERWPKLARRVGDAIRLVEAGRVCRRKDERYFDVNYLTYYINRKPYHIEPGLVLLNVTGYHCNCEDHENGVAGWYPTYTPRVELEPGNSSICCCHVLAVHIARMVEASND